MNSPMTRIKTEYSSLSELQRQSQFYKDRVLGIINFSESVHSNANVDNLPMMHLIAPVLDGAANACEVWLSGSEAVLSSGSKGAIKYRLNDELLFGVIQLDELPTYRHQSVYNTENTDALQIATESAYRQILALIDELGYPHLYRFWNYIADINGNSSGLERYRQFNIGRKHVLNDNNRESGCQLPAACALGLADGPLSIAFLVGRMAALAIENPRQISAYDYPEHYGPRTPSFSRATLLHDKQNVTLFVSGTASIVGHQTKHPADVINQTDETLANLEAVVAEANRVLGKPILDLRQAYLRAYIRNMADLPLVRSEIQRHLGDEIKAVFVQADICRAELLLEIEVTIQNVAKSI